MMVSCSPQRTKEGETFELYVFMQGPYVNMDMQIYNKKKLLLEGNFITLTSAEMIPGAFAPKTLYVASLKKEELSRIRLKVIGNNEYLKEREVDTVFSMSTINIDSLMIGINDFSDLMKLRKGVPGAFDNHDVFAWANKIPEKDYTELTLYAYLFLPYASERMEIYCNDSLLFNGSYTPVLDDFHMFIANIKKEELSRIRIKSMEVDTTFSVSTWDVDYAKVGISPWGEPHFIDNHNTNAWLIE